MNWFTSNSLQVGTGLVEIAALTTLIGSSSAESLILGDRGGAGVAWAAVSAFGSMSIIKGCVSGASPNWLRQTLGVRSAASDGATGLRLNLKSSTVPIKTLPGRDWVKHLESLCLSKGSVIDKDQKVPLMQDVYAFDRFISGPLDSVLASPEHGFPVVYSVIRDPYHRTVRKGDWFALGLSALKSVEIFTLWKLDAKTLGWITVLPWAHFFVAALILQALNISRSYSKNGKSEVDILAGELPTAKTLGGERKMLLGDPKSFRHHPLWRCMWIIGGLVCIATLIATYLLLGKEAPITVYSWIGFQLLWLFLRLVLYHVLSSSDHLVFPGLMGEEWKVLTPESKERAIGLLFALAKYQTHQHPRGSYSYEEDILSIDRADEILPAIRKNLQQAFPLPPTVQSLEVVIVGLLGDTVLNSGAWLSGSTLTGMDLYDTVLVIAEVAGEKIAVPAVRALSGSSLQKILAAVPKDAERAVSKFRSNKGLSNAGYGLTWIYWIPCTGSNWLQLASDDMKFLGARKAQVMTDEELTTRLDQPDLNISFVTVQDVKNALEFSRRGAEALSSLLL